MYVVSLLSYGSTNNLCIIPEKDPEVLEKVFNRIERIYNLSIERTPLDRTSRLTQYSTDAKNVFILVEYVREFDPDCY